MAFIASFKFFYIFFITLIEVIVVWGCYRLIIKLLDTYMPITTGNATKRFFKQFLITLFVYCILRMCIIYFESAFLDWSQNVRIILNSEIPIEITITILLNLLYIYWAHLAYTKEMERRHTLTPSSKTLLNSELKQASAPPNYIEIKKHFKEWLTTQNRIVQVE